MNVLRFLSYHNAVPITFSLIILGSGATFAAMNPDVVYNSTSKTVSIDNTYLVSKDLSMFSPGITIGQVHEDDDNYYVSYTLSTIDLVDGVWRDTAKARTLTVAKSVLGDHTDLGLYTAKQLREVVAFELQYLQQVQEIEKKQVSQKVVATEYGGLVGQFISNTTEELPGYMPVVQPQPVSPEVQTASAAAAPSSSPTPPQAAQEPNGPAPVLTIMGNNPARIPIGTPYIDLGAIVTDNINSNINITYIVDGVTMSEVVIDTSKVGEHTVRYEATNPAGVKGFSERVVLVYDPSQSTTQVTPAAVASSTASTTP